MSPLNAIVEDGSKAYETAVDDAIAEGPSPLQEEGMAKEDVIKIKARQGLRKDRIHKEHAQDAIKTIEEQLEVFKQELQKYVDDVTEKFLAAKKLCAAVLLMAKGDVDDKTENEIASHVEEISALLKDQSENEFALHDATLSNLPSKLDWDRKKADKAFGPIFLKLVEEHYEKLRAARSAVLQGDVKGKVVKMFQFEARAKDTYDRAVKLKHKSEMALSTELYKLETLERDVKLQHAEWSKQITGALVQSAKFCKTVSKSKDLKDFEATTITKYQTRLKQLPIHIKIARSKVKTHVIELENTMARLGQFPFDRETQARMEKLDKDLKAQKKELEAFEKDVDAKEYNCTDDEKYKDRVEELKL
jgi:hypothetical protein